MTLAKTRKSGSAVTLAISLGLALLASGVSLRIAIEAGHRLGSNPDERLFLASGGIVAVLGTHLLMSIFSQASVWPRLGAFALSMVCAVFVVYLHASFFLLVQAQAGARRVADVASSDASVAERAPAPRRGTSLILAELADVKADQARLRSRRCLDDCSRLDARDVVLKARIAALDAEADEVRRWLRDQDKLEARWATVKDDPVTLRLAELLGVTRGATGLVMGLLFAVILEGTGCLCWFLVLQRRDLTAVGSAPTEVMPQGLVTPPVAVTVEAVTVASRAVMPSVTPEGPFGIPTDEDLGKQGTCPAGEIDPKQVKVLLLVERVRPEIEGGRVRPTVTEIRKYLACARSTAAEVRRALEVG